jgi:hypothetical protein
VQVLRLTSQGGKRSQRLVPATTPRRTLLALDAKHGLRHRDRYGRRARSGRGVGVSGYFSFGVALVLRFPLMVGRVAATERRVRAA